MTFFHELLVLHKGGAKFKALVTGSLGSLETCFLEHTMTKVLFFFPKAARGIRMIKLYPLKNLHGWGCEGCAYLLDKTKYPSHLVGKGARCTSQQRYKGHAEQQLIRKQTLPLYLGSEVLQLWLHSVVFFHHINPYKLSKRQVQPQPEARGWTAVSQDSGHQIKQAHRQAWLQIPGQVAVTPLPVAKERLETPHTPLGPASHKPDMHWKKFKQNLLQSYKNLWVVVGLGNVCPIFISSLGRKKAPCFSTVLTEVCVIPCTAPQECPHPAC